MLKITVHEDQRTHTIKLEGKIGGLWVEELERTWTASHHHSVQRNCNLIYAVSLSRTTKVGNFCAKLSAIAAGFLTDSPLTKYFADEAIESRNQKHEGE